jgi:DMSO/TMAO reductase YedYZ heme-binding membrane subunit
VAIVVMVATVALSMPPIRRRLTYKGWHVSHLAMYLAVGLASLHQLNGAEFTSLPWLPGYWMALHARV